MRMVTEVFDRRWANATSIAVRVSFSILGPFQFADCVADHGCTSVQVWTILTDFIAGLRQPAQLLDVHPVATVLTTLNMPAVRVIGVVAHALPIAPSVPVHKSPSPAVAGNWLSTVVSTVAPTVSRTICFR